MKVSCRCGAEWSGLKREHCTVCHRTFSGTSTGDAHRTGQHGVDRRCLTDAELAKKGMRMTDARSNLWQSAPAENPHWKADQA